MGLSKLGPYNSQYPDTFKITKPDIIELAGKNTFSSQTMRRCRGIVNNHHSTGMAPHPMT